MPFARVDLIQGKPPEYRAKVADIVYRGIVDVLKAPDGDRFVVDELESQLSVRPDDVTINLVFVDRSDWSFGRGLPWT